MKKILVLILATLSLTLTSSNIGGGDPKLVAQKFLNHLNNKEFEEAKAYASLGTVAMLDMMVQLNAMAEGMGGAQEEPKEIVMGQCFISTDGMAAICKYTADGVEESIDLIQEGGVWKVNMPKEGAPTD